MYYKSSLEIYNSMVKDRGLYIPRLSFTEEMHLQLITTTISTLADVLNDDVQWFEWLNPYFLLNYVRVVREYKSSVVELKEFLDFWKFPLSEIDNKLKIEKFHGEA